MTKTNYTKPQVEVHKNKKTEAVKETLVGIVINGKLNIRQRPTKHSEALTYVETGTKMEILNDANEDWYRVKLDNGVIGYCMKEFISA